MNMCEQMWGETTASAKIRNNLKTFHGIQQLNSRALYAIRHFFLSQSFLENNFFFKAEAIRRRFSEFGQKSFFLYFTIIRDSFFTKNIHKWVTSNNNYNTEKFLFAQISPQLVTSSSLEFFMFFYGKLFFDSQSFISIRTRYWLTCL